MQGKNIIINADDVGIHPEADRAIAELGAAGIVSSASVMALGAPDRDALAVMLDHGVDLGLHLDFTSVFAARSYGTAYSVRTLIQHAWRRGLDPGHVRNIIAQQLDRFEDMIGDAPRFVDGHEHVHQFPVIREALFAVLDDRYPQRDFYLRNTGSRRWRGTKAAIIGLLGSGRLRRMGAARGHRCNTDFAGVYSFEPDRDLHSLWSGWLASIRDDGAVIMCHPAASLIPGDAIAPARVREFQFLVGDACRELFAAHSVRVTGWEDALAADI